MQRIATFLLLILATPSAAAAGADDTEVTVGTGTAAMHGSLLTTDGAAARAAALLIAGEGATNRDGNSLPSGPRPNTLKLLAQGLAAHGITSLRFDKRGVGASITAVTSEADVTLRTEVQDAMTWAAFLQSQPRVDCVVLIGHSQGALLATLAAQQAHVCGLVSLAGPGRPASESLKAVMDPKAAPASIISEFDAYIDELAAGERVDPVPASMELMLRPSIQPYLISWLPVDPAAELARIRVPVLIVQGNHDISVGVEEARILKKAQPAAQLLVLDGVHHVLKQGPAGLVGNLSSYEPNLPLDPRVVEAVSGFVSRCSTQAPH